MANATRSSLAPSDRPFLGILVGLKSEARLLRDLERDASVAVAVSGASSQRAAQLAEELVAKGAGALLSFGLCGALQPGLAAGDPVIPEQVLSAADAGRWDRFPVDAGWRQALIDDLPQPVATRLKRADLLGCDRVIAKAAEKQALGHASGALGVDMESHAVARVALRHGLPFLVVRACSDTAEQDLPQSALSATAPDGSLRLAPVLAGLARRPASLFGLLALGRASRAAHASLAQLARLPSLRALPRQPS
ncbi:MAG: phosphorylase [Pseudomonadota bacterium]